MASGTSAGGYVLALDSGGKAIGAGDWLAVEKEFPGDPAAGWWPTVRGGARLEAEQSDLPPGTPVLQALRIEAAGAGQSADVNSYFDSTAGKTFVRLRGRYRLRFLAKSVTGSTVLHVHVGRLAPGLRRYLDTDVELPRAWAGFSLEFDANEISRAAGGGGDGLQRQWWHGAAGRCGPGADRWRSREPDSLPRRSGGDAEGAAAWRAAADGERCGAGQHGGQPACAADGARSGPATAYGSRLPTTFPWGFRSFWNFAGRLARSRGSSRPRR